MSGVFMVDIIYFMVDIIYISSGFGGKVFSVIATHISHHYG